MRVILSLLVIFLLSADALAQSTTSRDQKRPPAWSAQSALTEAPSSPSTGSRQAIIFLKSDGPGPTRQVSRFFATIQPDGTSERKLGIQVTDAFPQFHVATRAPVFLYVRPTIANGGQSYLPTDDLILHDVVTDESRLVIQVPHATSVSGLSADGITLVYAETDGFDADYSCCVTRLTAINTQTRAKTPIAVNIVPRLKTKPVHPTRFAALHMILSPEGDWVGLRRSYYKTWPQAALLVHRPTNSTYQLGEGTDAAFITDVGRDRALFTISQFEDGPTDLYVFDFATKSTRLLVKGGYLGKLSPNNRKAAYLRACAKSGRLPAQDLWVLDETGRAKLIARHVAGDFAWSPDGMSLVYTMYGADTREPRVESLWIATVDGIANRMITSGNFNATSNPAWINY